MEATAHHPRRNRDSAGARRLIAGQSYFGIEASELRAGLARALARLSAQPADDARIDIRSLTEDFGIESGAGSELLGAFLTDGVLYPDGAGRYRPTRAFRDYSVARVVEPLSRERAKSLIGRSCRLAARINAEWAHVPLRIGMIAVSGGYMSCTEALTELTLSLVLGGRPEADAPADAPRLSREKAMREIVDAVKAQSSFLTVRVVSDRSVVQRPFGVVFEADEAPARPVPEPRARLRDLSASIGRWLARG